MLDLLFLWLSNARIEITNGNYVVGQKGVFRAPFGPKNARFWPFLVDIFWCPNDPKMVGNGVWGPISVFPMLRIVENGKIEEVDFVTAGALSR